MPVGFLVLCILSAAVAEQTEEQPVLDGSTFMLTAKGGRCLATSLDDTAVELVAGCEARLASGGAGGWRVAWTSLQAPGNRLYLRNGEVLLRALDNQSTKAPEGETEEEEEERVARSARWRVRGSRSRPKGNVALESAYGTFLRRAGDTVEQGRDYGDEAVWWTIVPLPDRCPAPTLSERLVSALSQYGWLGDDAPSLPECDPNRTPLTKLAPNPEPEPPMPAPAARQAQPDPAKPAPAAPVTARAPLPPAPAVEPSAPSAIEPPAPPSTTLAVDTPARPLAWRRRGVALPSLDLVAPKGLDLVQLRGKVVAALHLDDAMAVLPSRLSSLRMPSLPHLPRLPALPAPSFALTPRGVYALIGWLVLLSTAFFSGRLEPSRFGAVYTSLLRSLRSVPLPAPLAWLLGHVARLFERVASPLVVVARPAVVWCSSTLWACVRALRLDSDLAALLAHGAISNAASDVLAQAIETEVAVGSSALVNVDWPRVGRTTFASLISDDLPFLLWARLLWRMSRRYVLRIRAAPNLSPGVARALTHPAAVAATKALLSQIVYETVSAASYLSLQGAMRGGGARAALAEVRSKLWRVWRDGFAFFSATYLLVFALPRWWMQLVVDNIACLLFHTYMSHVSNRRLA